MTKDIYEIVKTTPEELENGEFEFSSKLNYLLHTDKTIDLEWKVGINRGGVNELSHALDWREGIEGDEYPYNHLQTDYQPLPLQKVELRATDEKNMVVTFTYTPYEDGEFATEYGVAYKNAIYINHWEITEYEKAGETQAGLRIVQKIYKLVYMCD